MSNTGNLDSSAPEVPSYDTSMLRQVKSRPSRLRYLRQLWERRHLMIFQAKMQTSHSNRGMLLGNIWLILAPILDGLIYFVIFGLVFSANRGVENFAGYLIVGVFMFTYTTRAISQCTTVMYNSRLMIKALAFPRISLPMSALIREAWSTIPVLAALLLLLLVLPPMEQWSWTALLIIPIFLLHSLFNLGFGLIVSRLGSQFPDSRQIIPYIIRALFYLSAVFFTVDRFEPIPILAAATEFNPLYLILSAYRDTLLYGSVPSLHTWITLIAWSIGLTIIGFDFFWRAEETYGRE